MAEHCFVVKAGNSVTRVPSIFPRQTGLSHVPLPTPSDLHRNRDGNPAETAKGRPHNRPERVNLA
jgi:hypothetical protein